MDLGVCFPVSKFDPELAHALHSSNLAVLQNFDFFTVEYAQTQEVNNTEATNAQLLIKLIDRQRI